MVMFKNYTFTKDFRFLLNVYQSVRNRYEGLVIRCYND